MDCPRCGGHVVVFELGDAVSRACEDCSYAGVVVDHRADPADSEGWEDAITRFRARFPESTPDGVDRVDDDAAPPERADGDLAAESGGLRLVGPARTASVDGLPEVPDDSEAGAADDGADAEGEGEADDEADADEETNGGGVTADDDSGVDDGAESTDDGETGDDEDAETADGAESTGDDEADADGGGDASDDGDDEGASADDDEGAPDDDHEAADDE